MENADRFLSIENDGAVGEAGTGKQFIVRATHERSWRKDRTFLKLNCAGGAAVSPAGEARKSTDVPPDTLTRQRALLDGLFARVPEAIVLLDTDHRILQVNPEFTMLFGYAQGEACGSLLNELVVPEELWAEAEECTRRWSGGESLNIEAVRKRKDGTRVHVSIVSGCVSIVGSQICEYVMYRDITKRKRAEQRLWESEAYLAEAQRLSQTGSWAWRPAAGDIRYWSETCYCVLGFDPAGPLPRFEGFFQRIHPDDQAASRERFEQAIRDKADFELDYRIVHPEKGIRDIHAIGHAVLDGSGNLVEFVGTVIDVTERKRAEQELRRSEVDLRTKNERLKLLLNVTNQITSNLELREVLRAVSSNIRDAMYCDAVFVSLVDSASGTPRLYVLDFPQSKGLIKEEIVYTISGAGKRVLKTLKPAVVDVSDPAAVPPEIYDKVVAEGLKSACLIPLINRDRVCGGLTIARKTETPFTPDDLEFLAQVSGQIAIGVENALAYHEISELKDKLAQEKLYLEEEIRSEMNFENIVGNSPALNRVLELVETVASTDATVLLLGETGTGKELIARAIHERSRRKDRTFVKLNCAAIPTGLLESELFGHEKGAFTGAITQKIGRMELADQGTLFLDEVGDIPIEIQPKLLRALQERDFERLGSIHTRRVNIRLVAATNRDLEKMIVDREFRSDLYYRLHVFPIRIPPLRDRKEDIPRLVSYFVQKFAKQMQKKIDSISPIVMKGLTTWEWPGNIRELENFIERAVIVTRGRSLEAPLEELRKTNTVAFQHVEQHNVEQAAAEITDSQSDKASVADGYERNQRDEIIRALTACRGSVGGAYGAAARLGVHRTTLIWRMKKYGIYAKQYAYPQHASSSSPHP
jgi:formate hydrogenlyase transcriptional activator